MTSSSPITNSLYSQQGDLSPTVPIERFIIKETHLPHSPEQATIERIDDIPLLMGLMQQIGLDTVIDTTISRHWLHQGLSIGQLIVGWLTFILSQEDHRKVSVRDWVSDHQTLLQDLLGESIRDTDFTDDRLGQVLTALNDDETWKAIEQRLWNQTVEVYSLAPQQVRLDATTITGHHSPTEAGLMQYGYSKDQTYVPQTKMMVASVDTPTNGHLIATDMVPGNCADDPLYQPLLARVRQILKQPGLLYIGDSKMSAIATRADIVAHGDFYLVPLAKVGDVDALLEQCIDNQVFGNQVATLVAEADLPVADRRLLAAGYETARHQSYSGDDGQTVTWTERLLVIRSFADADKAVTQLEQRLADAEEQLWALTPEPKRGRRQIRAENQLHQRAQAIIDRFGVDGLLSYTYAKEETTETRYIGRGRGAANRPKRTLIHTRYVMRAVKRNEVAIAASRCRMGWRLYATNGAQSTFTLEEAILLYRKAPRIERNFHLFKSAPIGIQPLYVRRNDQIKGLCRLLSLGVRLMTLIEMVTRRHLKEDGETLAGLYEGNPNQQTNRPTAVRLLKAFRQIDRVQFVVAGQRISYLTPLSPLQQRILKLLHLSPTLYEGLSFHNSG